MDFSGTRTQVNLHFFYALMLMISCALIYILFRSSSTLIYEVIAMGPLQKLAVAARSFVHQELSIPHWVIFNLPGALWVIACHHLLAAFRFPLVISKQLCYALLFTMIGIEFLQYLKLTDGVFDYFDLLAYAVALTWLNRSYSHCEEKSGGKPFMARNKWKAILIVSSFGGAIILSDLF